MTVLRDEVALIELVGINGEIFTLTGDYEGEQGVILNKGPQGLMEAPRKTLWGQGATQEGATYLGVSVEPMDLVLGFQVWGDNQDWHVRSSALRRAFDYDKEATLRVTTESETRTLRVRLLEAPQRDQDVDGRWRQYSLEVYTLRAAWPYWESETEFQTVTISGNSSGFTYKNLVVHNPTDTKLWPAWAFTAPGQWEFPDYDFVAGKEKSIRTPTLSSGQGLTVDTYPEARPYVAADGSNIAGRFGGVLPLNHAPAYTPDKELRVGFKGSGTGTATLMMRRFWNAPWGGE